MHLPTLFQEHGNPKSHKPKFKIQWATIFSTHLTLKHTIIYKINVGWFGIYEDLEQTRLLCVLRSISGSSR